MRNDLFSQAEQYRKRHSHRKIWHRIVSVLACIVVFCTTYALILPAITLEETAYCGLEAHSHTEDCYELQLVCGYDVPPDTVSTESVHFHTEDCYEDRQVLICDLEESSGHVHGESCIRQEQVLICTEEHDHTEDCYETTETYICGMTDGEGAHGHTPDCYETRSTLICDIPEAESTEPEPQHQHTEDCYASVLMCQKEAHEHTLACYSDPGADLESAASWERSVSGAELTGVWADDLIAIAQTQLGYTESTRNYRVLSDGTTIKGITRYGRWYGDPYGDWCAMFVSFCLHYAEIPETAIPCDAACQHWIDALSEQEWALYRAAEDYTPAKGDLIFFDWDDDAHADHVGLVQEVEDGTVTTIEGNSSNCVKRNKYQLEDTCIMGYGALPLNPEEPEKPTEAEEPTQAEEIPDTTRTLSATVYTDDTYEIPAEDAPEILITGNLPGDAVLLAAPLTVESEDPVIHAWQLTVQLPDGSSCAPGEDAALTVCIRSPALSGLEEGLVPRICQISASGEWEQVPFWETDGDIFFQTHDLSAPIVVTAGETPGEDIPQAVPLSGDYVYENGQFSIVFHVEGVATVQYDAPAAVSLFAADGQENTVLEPDAAEEPEDEPPLLAVTRLNAAQAEYQQLLSALDAEDPDALLELSVLSLDFYYQGMALDVSGCSVTARITPLSQLMASAQAACAQLEADAAPEAETGVVFAAVGTTDSGAQELDSAMVDASTTEAPVLTVTLGSDGLLAVAATQTANPKFTVQYYAWLDVVADSGDSSKSLDVIDTSGKVLPKNGTTPALKKLYLEQTAETSGKYQIKTVSTLTQVYQTHEYQYITAPNLTYFNRLYENGHYTMSEIWILKVGKSADSTDKADWDVYPATTHFTNRSQSVKEGTVLIGEGTVIRLVFDTTESAYTNAVSFYDYDITDDGTHTAAQGINSASNYSGSGAKLAFGNTNTDTGLEAELWNGNALNRYNGNAKYTNGNGYNGCTFGLASHLSDGKIQYSSGVIAPNLFNDGAATGKTSYDSGQYTLSFQRVGDTYTLSSVNGAETSGLQYFNNPGYGSTLHTHIWTNNFWPMDSVHNTDGHTGKVGSEGSYTGATKTGTFPVSDDGVAHNNMFGMHYTVKFTLTEDYIGPLEYYFFGDDDMWVFLDGTLVCDIGGVHSSVGEYVNLWDYVEKGSTGEHILSFFYTERGLSGSTCYMQFTLPSVSSITPEQNTGLLRVEKKVEGAVDSDEEFHFDIKFTDANGNPLPDDYSYTRYSAEGQMIKQDVIIYDGGSFELKAGEYIIVNYLPYGTKYTITETNAPYYSVSYSIDGSDATDGRTVEGSILSGHNPTVVYTNTAMPRLPETGGRGTIPYTTGGIALITSALLLLYSKKKRRKGAGASP